MDRRTLLKLAAATAATAALPIPAFAQGSPSNPPAFSQAGLDKYFLQAGLDKYFSEEELDKYVEGAVTRELVPFEKHVDEALAGVPYEKYEKAIAYKQDEAIWRKEALPFRLEPCHTAGSYYAYPVDLFTVEGTQVKRIEYAAEAFQFDVPANQPAKAPAPDFAGFHARGQLEQLGVFKDFLRFLGGTNFRAIADGQVFGAGAQALAINPGQGRDEEFPLFKAFWIKRPLSSADSSLVIWALLDSKTIVGRFKFTVTPGYETIIDTEAAIRIRRLTARPGIAPITSRFFFGPGVPPKRRDYRPRVHDSEALYIANGAGERIWRPLLNPERLQYSVFLDKKPKGFGLIQKERYFASYQDDDKQYEKRPSVWIEPLTGKLWDEGAVELIELPAPDEINENIVCFWRPKVPLGPIEKHDFSYRMHWCMSPDLENRNAVVSQTRLGENKSGQPSFIVDFYTEGCPDCNGSPLVPNVTASAGEIPRESIKLETLHAMAGMQRLRFDFIPAGSDPIDLRALLMANGKPVSDTWIFRWAR